MAAVAAGDVRETPSRTRVDAQIRNVGCQKAKAEACVGSPRETAVDSLQQYVRSCFESGNSSCSYIKPTNWAGKTGAKISIINNPSTLHGTDQVVSI